MLWWMEFYLNTQPKVLLTVSNGHFSISAVFTVGKIQGCDHFAQVPLGNRGILDTMHNYLSTPYCTLLLCSCNNPPTHIQSLQHSFALHWKYSRIEKLYRYQITNLPWSILDKITFLRHREKTAWHGNTFCIVGHSWEGPPVTRGFFIQMARTTEIS